MYTTCLFCHGDLGRNEVVEAFPVGRRLAFDLAKGRLWVVCRKCERWNLTPLEERWEAMEECERRFRDTKLRVSTDNIGLARLREGLELVRVGAAQRPEMAAWRYGDQFGRRRRRYLLSAAGGLAAITVVGAVGMSIATAAFAGFAGGLFSGAQRVVFGGTEDVIARIPASIGVLTVQRKHLEDCLFYAASDGVPWGLKVVHKGGSAILRGDEARHAAALMLPGINRYGASARRVQDAVARLEATGGPERFVEDLVRRAVSVPLIPGYPTPVRTGPSNFGAVDRFALEMALHEEQERRALDGELAALERAWQAAEEVAAIADGMLVPDAVTRTMSRLRAQSGDTSGGSPA